MDDLRGPGKALTHVPHAVSSPHPFHTWTDKVTNNIVLERAGVPTIFTLLRQRKLRWLGHVRRMSDGRISKDLLYGELDHGLRPVGLRSCVSRTHVSET